jgi:hypothetical protein
MPGIRAHITNGTEAGAQLDDLLAAQRARRQRLHQAVDELRGCRPQGVADGI